METRRDAPDAQLARFRGEPPHPGPDTGPGEGLEERIRYLFSSDDDALDEERRLDARVAELVREFLRDGQISSEVDLGDLVDRFTDTRVPEWPLPLPEHLEHLEARVLPHVMRVSAPRFIGHMTSSLPFFVRPLVKLMTAMNQNVVKTETSKVLTSYERQALARLHRLIYRLPDAFYDEHVQESDSTLGMITSGGTVANVTALWCARNRRLGPDAGFRGVEKAGLAAALAHHGFRGAAVVGSALMHYSFEKAAELLGLGTDDLVRVPTGPDGGVDLRAMRAAVERCRERGPVLAVVGVAGSTDCGSIDDLHALADLAEEHGAHFHVDAAWGGPLIFSDRHRSRLDGIERADSVTFDGHKQLYLPMGIGMLFLRDPHLARGIERHAQYTVRAGSADLGQRSLEGSRPAMSFLLHSALELLGHRGYAHLVDEGIRKARYMADAIRSRPEFELLSDPRMNIILYRYVPGEWRTEAEAGQLSARGHEEINAFNELLQKVQRDCGRTFVSRTRLTRGGRPVVALRVVLANPLTGEEDIDAVLDDQVALAETLAAGPAWRVA